MDDNFDKIFSDEEPTENTEVETTEPVVETTETAPETETETETVTAPDPNEEWQRKEAGLIRAAQEERARRQEADRLRVEYEQRLRAYEEQQAQQNRPDPFDNPEAYDQHVQKVAAAQVQQALLNRDRQAHLVNFTTSHQRAAETHGQEAVSAALSWAEQRARNDEMWGRQALSQPDPVSWMVEQQARHAELDEFSRDPDGFKARIAAEMGAGTAQAASTNQPRAEIIKAPNSLAGKVSNQAAKPTDQTDKEWMDSLFNQKR